MTNLKKLKQLNAQKQKLSRKFEKQMRLEFVEKKKLVEIERLLKYKTIKPLENLLLRGAAPPSPTCFRAGGVGCWGVAAGFAQV